MTKYSGSDLVVTFGGTTISDHGASVDVDEDHATPDVTSFGDDNGAYIGGGVTHRKASFDGFDDTAGAVYAAIAPGTSGTLLIYPQGNVTGNPRRSVNALVTKRKRGFKIGDKVALSAEFQMDGVLTADTVPA